MKKTIYVPRTTGNHSHSLLLVVDKIRKSVYVREVGRLDNKHHLIGNERHMKEQTLTQGYKPQTFISADEIPDDVNCENEIWVRVDGAMYYPEWVLHRQVEPPTSAEPEVETVAPPVNLDKALEALTREVQSLRVDVRNLHRQMASQVPLFDDDDVPPAYINGVSEHAAPVGGGR